MTYLEKLKDPRWQRKRLEVMERDDFRCRSCDDRRKTLNVHHTYYQRGFMPWEYPSDSLVTLCGDCHKELESRLPELLQTITTPATAMLAIRIMEAATSNNIAMGWLVELCPVIDSMNDAADYMRQGDHEGAAEAARQAMCVADYLHDCITALASPFQSHSLGSAPNCGLKWSDGEGESK